MNHRYDHEFFAEQGNTITTKSAQELTEAKQTTKIIYILFLVGFIMPIMPLIGLIMALIKRKEMVGTLYYNHLTYLIRTFVITLIGCVISIIATIILIGFLSLILLSIWNIFRIIYGFIQFQNDKNIDPTKWFIA